jgi:HEPN domain-containing protein
MKNETKQWLTFADENLQSAHILAKSHLYNPSLQNSQQAIEKYIKACLIEHGIKLQKTHSILSLNEKLKQNDIQLSITEDDIDLIDSIYLSSKYPFGSVLPDFEPDEKISLQCIEIAKQVQKDINRVLQ